MSGKTYEFMAFLRRDSEDEDRVDTVALRYETGMPWSVFLFSRIGIRRHISRDLIHEGFLRPVGNDDDIVDQDFLVVSPEGTEFIEFRVFHEGEFVNILVQRGELVKACDDWGRMVPRGREGEFMDWAAGAARCQKASDR